MTAEKKNKERLYHLDLIRFISALYVVFFHYAYRGFAKDNLSILQFPFIEEVSKYGYLGVELFFIISGFVILLSVRNSNLIDFCISRFTRLYPAYWFCVILTALTMALFGGTIFTVSFGQVIYNLTMFNGFVGIEHVDGVYWSLLVELKFYILIGALLFLKLIKHIRVFGYFLLIISIVQLLLPFSQAPKLLQVIYYFTFPNHSVYFVAGMFFYLIKSEKKILNNIPPLIIAYVIAIKYAILDVTGRNDRYPDIFSIDIVTLLITLFFILMFLVSINKLNIFNKKLFYYFGILTYPLYLLHQNIGYIIFNNFGNLINKWLLLILVILIMIISAYLISVYIERPLGQYLRTQLKSNHFLLKLKAKLNH